jgi:hypothetical protein
VAQKKRHSPALRAHMQTIADEVIGLPNAPVRQMRGQAALAGGALAAVLAAWFSEQDPASPFTMSKYRSLLLALRKSGSKGTRIPKIPVWVSELGDGLRDTLTKGAKRAVKSSVSHTLSQAIRIDQEHPELPIMKIPSAVKTVARAESVIKPRLDIIAERSEESLWNRVRGGFMQGVFREESIEEVGRRLGGTAARVAFEDSSFADNIADRILGGVESILERTIKTEIMTAYNTAADKTMEALSDANDELVWFKRWDSELDEKVCEVCADLHGDTIEVDEEFDNEYSPDGPPAHPSCRCLLTVWTEVRNGGDEGNKPTSDNEAATAASEE